mmetsp:Transcript_61634/g.127356  ORF Transcript_61634/g.127356 Transcript_61634/m.127356 type:complete len:202 (+) Transcript_61634:224-829(+)
MEINGGSVIVMGGKNCLAIASDLRFGLENFTHGSSAPKMFKIDGKTFIGMTGLIGDIYSVKQNLEYKISFYSLNESKKIRIMVLITMLSILLYQNRFSPFLIETIVGGINEEKLPVICSMDVLGATSFSSKFAVTGTCSESLYGICENFWKPEMNPEELFETISHCLILGLNRDCLSGWGGLVHIISTSGTITKSLKTKMD